jgi:hypothetical protein
MLRSSKWSSGCGNGLVLGPEIRVIGVLSEDVVVVACLKKLEKELDRRRALQALVVVVAVAADA